MKKWDEKLANLSANLAELSQKAASASEDAKAARELRQEVISDRISTAKGNMVAFQERVRLSKEENKSKISSALLKAQMTVEAKVRQHKENRDRKLFEAYIDDQINYIYENFESATYLINNAQVAILEAVEAINEYEEKYGTREEDRQPEEETAAEETAEAAETEASEETASEDEAKAEA